MRNDECLRPSAPTEETNREAEQVLDTIDRSTSVAVKGGEETIYCLSVIGQVEGPRHP